MFDEDAIYQDADIEQAELEAVGDEIWAAIKKGDKLRAAGLPFEAAGRCPHTAGYGLNGSHARDVGDPHAGSEAVVFRCSHCGAGLDREPWDGDARILNVELSTIVQEGA